MVRRFFFSFLSLAMVLALSKGWYKMRSGFSYYKVAPSFSPKTSWGVFEEPFSTLKEKGEIERVLEQKFHFLARGQQSYAFASEDGNYVVKLIHMHKFRYPFWSCVKWGFAPLDRFCQKKREEKKHIEKRWLESYELAEKYLKEESGLVYLHLHSTKGIRKNISFLDPLGRELFFPADQIYFILQRKAKPWLPVLEKHLEGGEDEEVLSILSSFFSTISHRYTLGIVNKNRRCMKNFGLLEGKVMEYDVGEFIDKTDLLAEKGVSEEMVKFTRDVRRWLEKKGAHLLIHFDKELEKAIEKQNDFFLKEGKKCV